MVVVGVAWALAWSTNGSIDASDWLPYSIVCAVCLVAVLVSGTAMAPSRRPWIAILLLVLFGVWTAASIAWSPLPSSARDGALLALLYAIAFATPILTLRTHADRMTAIALAVFALSLLAVVTAVHVLRAGHVLDVYLENRLDFPISYWNGAAALFLVGVWPAIALSAERRLPPYARAIALGGATAMVAVFVMTQSKGGALGLAVSGLAFFVVSRERLRAIIPSAVVAMLVGAAAGELTAPYRAADSTMLGSIHHAGAIALIITAVATLVGFAYAVVDERVTLPGGRVRMIRNILAIVAALVVLGGAGAFFARVHHPIRFAENRWDSFKTLPADDTASSHFTSLGSSRYDYYRVAILEFKKHPLAGLGGGGWAAAYLQYGRTSETPERSHSIEFDALSETGIVGLLLLLGAGFYGLAAVTRRTRPPLLAASLFASGVYLAVHTAVDWIWTIPSVGLAALVFVGIGASRGTWRQLPARYGLVSAAAVAAVAVVGFAPPWLSARFTDDAYGERAPAATSSLDWARKLDPLSVEPLLAQAAIAASPNNVPPLEQAVARQPGDAEVHYLLGLAYLDAEEARRRPPRAADRRAPLTPGSGDPLGPLPRPLIVSRAR